MDKKTILIIGVILAAVVIAGVALGFGLKNPNKTAVTSATTSKAEVTEAKKEKTGQKSEAESTTVDSGKKALDGAKIKDSEAIKLISDMSDKELGIKNKKDYKFMFSGSRYEIEGKSYVQVIAAKVTDNGDKTSSITPYGEYYISFDGKTVLRKDMKTGEYSKIK